MKGDFKKNLEDFFSEKIKVPTEEIENSENNIELLGNDNVQFFYLEIAELERGEYQPRDDFDAKELNLLVKSIKQHGLLQPILAHRHSNGTFEIVAGERRVRAAQNAGLTQIPAIVRDMNRHERAAACLIENVQRQALDFFEQGRGFERLIKDFQMTKTDIANLVGLNRSTVSNVIRILSLDPEVQEQIRMQKIEMGHARALLPLKLNDQLKMIEKISKLSLSVRATEKIVNEILNQKMKNPQETKPKRELIAEEERLKNLWGREVEIKNRKSGGKIIINYSDLNDLKQFIVQLQEKQL